MMADSSTATITNSEEGSGGGISPSRWRTLPSPWAQVVRRGGVEESGAPRSPSSSPVPLVSEQNNVVSDQLKVIEPEPEPALEIQSEVPDDSNAGGKKKSAWNNPSANGVVEGSTSPVMGAASWPALSESTRPITKALSSSDSSSNPTSAGSVTVSQAPVISQPPQKPAKSYTSSHSNANHTHPRRSMKRGGGAGGASAGYNRSMPPPPPPMPPPFPLFDMSYGNFIQPVLDSAGREQPLYNGNGWAPRPRNGSYVLHNHSSNRNPSRRNNFGPHPRGDGGLYLNNGYGGRHDHQDRDWHGSRSRATRDAHIPHQMVPPPPPPPGAYMRQPNPGPAPYIVPPPIRPYMGYEMASFVYLPTLPPEPYRSPPLLPHAPPPSMLLPVMDPPLNVRILNQIEYYFSDANLVKDNFLRSNMDEEGWVPITLIAGFPRVQSLTTDVQLILNSLRDSSVVEVQGDKLRRRNEWSRWIQSAGRFPSNSSSRSLLEENSLEKLTLEETTTNERDISDKKENDIGQMGTNDSSNLASGEVSTESTRA